MNYGKRRDLDSDKWNYKLTRDLGADQMASGTFFMDFRDFIDAMNGFDVCYYEENYEHSTVRMVTDQQKCTVLNVKIKKAGTYYFSAHQINARAFKDSESKQLIMTRIHLLSTYYDPR